MRLSPRSSGECAQDLPKCHRSWPMVRLLTFCPDRDSLMAVQAGWSRAKELARWLLDGMPRYGSLGRCEPHPRKTGRLMQVTRSSLVLTLLCFGAVSSANAEINGFSLNKITADNISGSLSDRIGPNSSDSEHAWGRSGACIELDHNRAG